MARPPLPRYRADLVIAIELGAEDEEHANQRVEALLDLIRPRLGATVRATRIGAASMVHAHALDNASAV